MMMNDSCQQLAKLAPPGLSRALLAGLDAGLAMRVDDRPQSIAGWRRLLGLNEAAALPAPAAAARAYRRPLSISVGIAAALLLVGGGYLAVEPGKSGKAVPVDLVAEVQGAREALAVAEQRARQREEEEAQVQRTAQQEVADRERAEEEARRAAAAKLERDRAEAGPAPESRTGSRPTEGEAEAASGRSPKRRRGARPKSGRRRRIAWSRRDCQGRGGEGGDPAGTR